MEIFVLRDGQQSGPFNEDTLKSLCMGGGFALNDMAWHQGLPGWLPLGEVLKPGSARPKSPPPALVESGLRKAPEKYATAKQRALLEYLGATFDDDITKESAAIAISDALENPKFTLRVQKWQEEKFQLHADLFQDEIDYRRALRVARHLELCKTEGAEVVKDVTKAHVQVLIESLDKRQPGWDSVPLDGFWSRLVPAIAEHFPQLMQEDWETRRKSAAPAAAPLALDLPPEPAGGSALSAALRGFAYGGAVLAILFAVYFFYPRHSSVVTPPEPKLAAPAPAPGSILPSPDEGAAAGVPPAGNFPEIAPFPNASAELAPTPDPLAPPAPDPIPMLPIPDQADQVPAPGLIVDIPPAPAPPGVTPDPAPLPAPVPSTPTPPAGGGYKSVLTITKPISVQLQFGRVTLNPGTHVRFIAVEGQNVRVNFNNNVILVPIQATDVDPTATPPSASTPLPQPFPTTTTAPRPSADL